MDESRGSRSVKEVAEGLVGEGIRLDTPALVKDGLRTRVYRSYVLSAKTRSTSVIIKQIKEAKEIERGYTDWASLAFLSDLKETAPLAPRFFGGDPVSRVYCIEDLGGSQSIQDLLSSSSETQVQEAFRALSVQTARLNLATIGKEKRFEEIRGTLPGREFVRRQRDADTWVSNLEKAYSWLEAFDVEVTSELKATLDKVANTYRDPGQFLAFTHGDFAPTNNHVSDDGVRLLDFEFGGYRHALYDVTAWDVLCPMSEGLVGEIKSTYRSELQKGMPSAEDSALFNEAWATMVTYRAIAISSWLPLSILDKDQPMVGEWSCRQALVGAFLRLANRTSTVETLGLLTDKANELAKRMQNRWPEINEIVTSWPALSKS